MGKDMLRKVFLDTMPLNMHILPGLSHTETASTLPPLPLVALTPTLAGRVTPRLVRRGAPCFAHLLALGRALGKASLASGGAISLARRRGCVVALRLTPLLALRQALVLVSALTGRVIPLLVLRWATRLAHLLAHGLAFLGGASLASGFAVSLARRRGLGLALALWPVTWWSPPLAPALACCLAPVPALLWARWLGLRRAPWLTTGWAFVSATGLESRLAPLLALRLACVLLATPGLLLCSAGPLLCFRTVVLFTLALLLLSSSSCDTPAVAAALPWGVVGGEALLGDAGVKAANWCSGALRPFLRPLT